MLKLHIHIYTHTYIYIYKLRLAHKEQKCKDKLMLITKISCYRHLQQNCNPVTNALALFSQNMHCLSANLQTVQYTYIFLQYIYVKQYGAWPIAKKNREIILQCFGSRFRGSSGSGYGLIFLAGSGSGINK